MVSQQKAIRASAISAVVVGVAHYIAHKMFAFAPIQQQVWMVGSVVVLAVFGVAYYGMRKS